MARRLIMMAVTMAFLATAAPAVAHDDYRVIGTIVKVTAKVIDVKQTKDGKTISMDLNAGTRVTRDKKKVSAADLKVGLSVVVDARGDDIDDLVVVTIRLVDSPIKK